MTHENSPPIDANVLLSILRLILLSIALVTAISIARPQQKREQKHVAKRSQRSFRGRRRFSGTALPATERTVRETVLRPEALKPPPSDLTTLSKRHEGKFPAGLCGCRAEIRQKPRFARIGRHAGLGVAV